MAILSDSAIKAAMKRREIVIEPFKESALGGNSYDVHLGPVILTHDPHDDEGFVRPLDVRKQPRVTRHEIPPNGMVLHPGRLYLASTVEYTETHKHVPYLDGKSSTGRLGIGIHLTAGRGDVGFCNHWTLEIFVIEPIIVVAGMPIGQLTFHTVEGEVVQVYSRKSTASYASERNPDPQPSRLWTKFR